MWDLHLLDFYKYLHMIMLLTDKTNLISFYRLKGQNKIINTFCFPKRPCSILRVLKWYDKYSIYKQKRESSRIVFFFFLLFLFLLLLVLLQKLFPFIYDTTDRYRVHLAWPNLKKMALILPTEPKEPVLQVLYVIKDINLTKEHKNCN